MQNCKKLRKSNMSVRIVRISAKFREVETFASLFSPRSDASRPISKPKTICANRFYQCCLCAVSVVNL